MKCLVLFSRSYTKKTGDPGVITSILYQGRNGLDNKTIFDPTLYTPGGLYDFQFDPNGFLVCAGQLGMSESFEILTAEMQGA